MCILAFVAVSSGQTPPKGVDEPDPFSSISARPTPAVETGVSSNSWDAGFFSDNFAFRKELMSEFGATDSGSSPNHLASRQSVGFETQKKFSSETRTFASLDFQGRLVRRDGFVGSPNDMEGMRRPGWFFEYHNAYADFYDFLNPFFSEEMQSANIGRFNARLGRFYVPFGLNLQTDTHGTVLQLSNERNFGFERDWSAGFWGTLTEDLRYDLYYLTGSGYDLKNEGQSGLGAARVSLANKYSAEYGLEGGLSLIGGERLSTEAMERSPAVMAAANDSTRVDTLRAGLDARWRRVVPGGLMTWTSEVSGGEDAPDPVAAQLHQLEYLHSSRTWGLSAQYRWFWQDMSRDHQLAPANAPRSVDSSVLLEGTWYLSNDVSNSNLHWIKLNCEIQTDRQMGGNGVIWTLQYYRYF